MSAPMLGHLFPMVPLAAALRDAGHDAGHDVVVATGGEAVRADIGGLPLCDVAPGFRFPAEVAARLGTLA